MTPARALALINIFNRRITAGELTVYEHKRHIRHIMEKLELYREEKKRERSNSEEAKKKGETGNSR
jgi:hypothetical protein